MGEHSFYHHELFRHVITAFTFFFFFFFLVILKCMCFRSPRDTHRSISVSCFLRHQIYTFFQCVKQIRAHQRFEMAVWYFVLFVVFPLKGFRLVPEKCFPFSFRVRFTSLRSLLVKLNRKNVCFSDRYLIYYQLFEVTRLQVGSRH